MRKWDSHAEERRQKSVLSKFWQYAMNHDPNLWMLAGTVPVKLSLLLICQKMPEKCTSLTSSFLLPITENLMVSVLKRKRWDREKYVMEHWRMNIILEELSSLLSLETDNQLEIGRNIDIFFILIECQNMWTFHCETFFMCKYIKSITKILY